MAAYFLVDVDISDAAGFEEYRSLVPAVIEKYGGKYIVRGGRFEQVEGEWQPKRLVLLEFLSMEQAKRFYDSEDYHPLKALRFRTAKTNAILVEGV